MGFNNVMEKEMDFTRVDGGSEEEIRKGKEARWAEMIAKAKSFEELKSIINREQIVLRGSQEIYGPVDLVYIMEAIRDRKMALTAATSTAGFREIVRKLAEKEGVISKEEDS